MLLPAQKNITNVDFIQWLGEAIKIKEHYNLLSNAIKNNNEINIDTESSIKGVAYHWSIFSFPLHSDSTPEKKQLTCLQDLSAATGNGMTDIATSVIHNIGNVLNSINTSVNLINKKITSSKLSRLSDISKLFLQHKNDIATFIAQDPQGQHIPEYMPMLAEMWEKDKQSVLEEIEILDKSIEHIKSIINMQ
jgi:hypothetical protein